MKETALIRLTVWVDDEPRDGPLNMALDEVLLRSSSTSVLRVYRWSGLWASLGYFASLSETQSAFPGRLLVRRWTGGGIVDHAEDWTYSLIVPREEPFATCGTAASYCAIHSALATALAAVGVSAALAEARAPGKAGLCFEQAVMADVVNQHGLKLAGAAQRRTRHGLLHQGSVRCVEQSASLASLLAAALSSTPPLPFQSVASDVVAQAESLAREKYGSAAWLHRC